MPTTMNAVTVTTLLLIAFVYSAEAFPIAGSQTSVRRQHYRLYSSAVGNDNASADDESLSNLLGEMFQAKLEMSQEAKELESLVSENKDMPVRGNDGIYRIVSQNQLENFKAANADKLVFLKFSSPICAACRMLKQKFQTLHRSPKFADAPVVFADIVVSNNKKVQDPFRDYITSQLQVRRIPSIHFYAGSMVDQIFCDEEVGCSWPKIQQQMLDFIGQYSTTPSLATAQNVSSVGAVVPSVGTVASAAAQPSATTISTGVADPAMSKLKRIRRLLSLSWFR